MIFDFEKYYADRQKLINTFIEKRMSYKALTTVDEAMKYSLLAGGKRIRPILLMAAADAIGVNGYNFLNLAAGLEMIHTYSLIHDDLPCMDNDDYRRGSLTNHKVYGEAMALLAGDGLLTLAFEVLLEQKKLPAEKLLQIVHEIAMCAGSYGMVGGQAMDLAFENKAISAEELKKLHAGKTGAMFIAAIRSGAIAAGAIDKELLALTKFADLFGLAFQISDDIMDVTCTKETMGKNPGSDEKLHKSTYVSLFGLDGAKKLLAETIAEAEACVDIFEDRGKPLLRLVQMLSERKH